MRISILYISVVSLINFSCAHSQGKKDVQKYNIRSKSVSVSEGDKTRKTSFERYDVAGNVVEEIDYNKEGEVKKHETYKFNKNGNDVEHVIYNPDGSVKKKTLTKYDPDNNKAMEEEYIDGVLKQKTVYSYSKFGERIGEIIYDASGGIVEKSTYTYNNKGLRTEKKTFDSNGKVISTKIFSYEF
jgi:uncharacterized protein YkuJ